MNSILLNETKGENFSHVSNEKPDMEEMNVTYIFLVFAFVVQGTYSDFCSVSFIVVGCHVF